MRRPAILWAGVMILALVLPQLACAQDALIPADALSSFRAGRYAEAIDISRSLLRSTPDSREMRTVLVESLAAIGHYDEALEAAEPLPVARGRIYYEIGRSAEADAEFARAIQAADPDRLTAELYQAIIRWDRGERDEAMTRFDRFIDVYNASDRLSANDLTAVGTAVRYLGVRDPALFNDAIKAYDEAIQADAQAIEPRLLVGELFIDKYDSPQAHQAFNEVFAFNPVQPRALLGMARAKFFDGDVAAAVELANQSLQINYQFVPARVLLARARLDSEDLAGAEEEVQKALAVNPNSIEALTLRATILYLRGDRRGYEQVRDRVMELNPKYAGFHVTIAEVAAQQRRYPEASEMAKLAVQVDPQAWGAYGTLGLNELRLGHVDEAREHLEKSFKGDPYNAWVKNTLDLLDTFGNYELVSSPHFVFMLHRDEAELLRPYLSELAEEAYASMTARYGVEPQTPVRVEVYPRHEDFSVRTVGLTGLGALGVAFGNVLAMDSPAAREAGRANWGTTLWHELGHTIALALSNNRVPRWFTEGLSVHEERLARPGWGSETTPEFMAAYDANEIPPVSRLNDGFTRPASPRHLALAYHGASLVIQWIEETRGFPAIVRILREFGEGRSSEAALREVLGGNAEQIDQEFDRWLRSRHPAGQARDYEARVTEAARLVREGRYDQAEQHLAPIATLFEGADTDLQTLMSRIRLGQGDTATAMQALEKVASIDENAYWANTMLADLAGQADEAGRVAEALERVMYIHPYEADHHSRLATAYAERGDAAKAVRERRAVVALRPVDRAEALYQLALALRAAGQLDEARAQVVRALEVAPSFERAQELLLELSGTE